jgi:hypothetical protein
MKYKAWEINLLADLILIEFHKYGMASDYAMYELQSCCEDWLSGGAKFNDKTFFAELDMTFGMDKKPFRKVYQKYLKELKKMRRIIF